MASQQYTQRIPLHPTNTKYHGGFKPALGAYTEVSDVEVPPHRQKSFHQKYFSGIRRTLRAFLAVACLILVINIIWLCVAKAKYGIKDGYGTIQEGDCSAVKKSNTWFHFLINVLSTLLLTGSNAFMTAFSCPNRQEVDEAHRRGKFVHVGTFSFGNLRRIAKRKGLVVLVLALSSIPFHLLYNSLIFTDIVANQYYWSIVTEDFLTGAPFNLTGPLRQYSSGGTPYFSYSASAPSRNITTQYSSPMKDTLEYAQVMNDYFTDMQTSASKWERLSNKDCIQAYSNVFLSERRNIVLVSSAQNNTNSIMRYGDASFSGSDLDNNWWICSEEGQDGGSMTCNPNDYKSKADSWTVFDYPIKYCLSEATEDVCSVRFSMTIMLVVIAFNAVKVLFMLWVLLKYDAEKILTSVGDAVSSFLQIEDLTTVQMCLANKRQMRQFWQQRGFARPFSRYSSRWGAAVSRKRWTLFFFFMIMAFLFAAFFGLWGFIHVKDEGIGLSPSSLWELGFGSLNQNAMIFPGPSGESPIVMAIIANIPQVILSIIYVVYMGMMTSMFLAKDWSAFAFKPQTLMVSSPVGRQRGTWLFGAPMGWGLALMIFQFLLHWFISQSIFMVQLTIYDKDGKPLIPDPDDNKFTDFTKYSNCGYSPIAIIVSMVTAGLMLLSSIIFCWRRFPGGSPPVVGTCSAAISAAVHPMSKNEDMRFEELRWGVDGVYPNGVGHCSIMEAWKWDRGLASAPIYGYTYAGVVKDHS